MLLFIELALQFYKNHLKSFNTSHVVIYLGLIAHVGHIKTCFNTSHVVIYRNKKVFRRKKQQFQYISCCYLSLLASMGYRHMY